MAGTTESASDGWVETEPGWLPAEVLELDRLELIDEVVHTVRGTILRYLRRPHTVGELAELLGVPITRLYHHVNRLEADGLVRVEATRRVGGVVERRYRAVARSLELSPALYEQAEGPELGRAVGGIFDVAKSALQREFELGSHVGYFHDDRAIVSLGELRLTDERRDELMARLRSIIDEFTGDAPPPDDPRSPFRLFVAAFPVTP